MILGKKIELNVIRQSSLFGLNDFYSPKLESHIYNIVYLEVLVNSRNILTLIRLKL